MREIKRPDWSRTLELAGEGRRGTKGTRCTVRDWDAEFRFA